MSLAAISLANWAQRGRFGVPEDGVVWADSEAGISASWVESESPAALVGVRPGDILISIGGRSVAEALDATRFLAEIGAWSRTQYEIERNGQLHRFSVVIGESASRGAVAGFLMVLGWAYALIGLLVYQRCQENPTTIRFYAFCLASLAVYSLSATGQFDIFDRLVYWLDVWALLLMPPLFLDFCARFATGTPRQRALPGIGYCLAVAVGSAHHAAAGGWVAEGIADPALVTFFDSVPLALLVANVLAGATLIWSAGSDSGNPVLQLQSKWLLFGSVAAIIPFAAFYAVPYLAGFAPGPNQAFAVLSLALLPASIGVALVRYRLMDFELVWRRSLASALTGGLLLAIGYAGLFGGGSAPAWLERYGPLVWLGSLTLAALLFTRIRDWILRGLERRAYRDRYDDRRTLAAFAAALAAESDLSRMVANVGERLVRTLGVDRVAVLVPQDGSEGDGSRFGLLYSSAGDAASSPPALDLRAVADSATSKRSSIVIADPSADLPKPVAELGCRHFVPCRMHGRTLAWIGLGLTDSGSFLTSDDLELVETLAGPFAIALENARLYASLEAKATQYQILKDYNENIIESLSVGILVLDMEGRVQSWNTHLELDFHIARDQAVGRDVRELLPASLVEEFERCQDESGTGNAYKFRLRAADFPAEFRPSDSAETPERVINLAVAPLIAKDFRRIGRLVILDDVTDRIELEERVVRADRLSSVGLLAAGVAHEVNTPLAVISSYSQMLASKFTQGSEEAKVLGKMTEQTFRASEIVSSLLDFSRTSESSMAPCDLNGAIGDTIDLIGPQLRVAGVSVEQDLGGGASVVANRRKLEQVFLNLFLNARDAMPSGGRLRIVSRVLREAERAPLVEVLVSDTGTGMDETVRRRIFDPFYTTKDGRRGTGLGLAVSYGIVREHSGSISVESAPGEGTTFRLSLPLAKQPVHA